MSTQSAAHDLDGPKRVRTLRLAALRGSRVTSQHLSQIGVPPPATARQLIDLAYDGQSVWIACHLDDVGLGDLEDTERRLIEREVEFALVEAGSTSVDTYARPGSGEIKWVWPKAAFVNAASVSVGVYRKPDGSGRPSTQLVEPYTHETRRDPDEPSGSVEISLSDPHVDYELRLSLSLAVRSESSGRVYPGYESELAVIQVPGIPRRESVRKTRLEANERRPRSTPKLVVADPTQPRPGLLTRLRGRAALITTATILFLGVIAAALWAFSGGESDYYQSCTPIFGTPTGEPVNWSSPTVLLPEGVQVIEGMFCEIGNN